VLSGRKGKNRDLRLCNHNIGMSRKGNMKEERRKNRIEGRMTKNKVEKHAGIISFNQGTVDCTVLQRC